ncbi:hypothetical protein POF51_23490 [Brevibacillus sp. AG]|nr:hypothetical protein [Brevibacillus sp. AG]MDC0763687.1 hypothetical protein [Brevibacillus sp. AG]
MFAYVIKHESGRFSDRIQLYRYAFYAMYQRIVAWLKGEPAPFPIGCGCR